MPSSYTIGERYERMIRDLVESGRYTTASEVVRDSLRLLEEREQMRQAKLDRLRHLIEEGLQSGPGEPLDVEAIRSEARRVGARKP